MTAVEPVLVNRLHEHEAAIERSLSELGWHLRAIRDERLYRAEYETFEDYCRQRWTYSRRYVDMQIAAAETIDAIGATRTIVPTNEAQVRPLHALPETDRVEAWTEAVEIAGGVPTAKVVAEVVAGRRVPLIVPTGGKGHDGPPHPATYPAAVLDLFRELLVGRTTVLDPFAGVGTIHDLRPQWETYGIELEREWAMVRRHTIIGDARAAGELYSGHQFSAVATSPAYGNRLADAFYNAHDAEGRRTYAFDLGRPLTAGNGAGMAFGDEYRVLHRAVWAAVVALLEPGGLFLLNCKDFVRGGAVVPVTGWHIGELAALGLRAVDLRTLPAAGLPYASAKPMSEIVVALVKS